MLINNLTKKRILVSVVTSSILMLSGCGSNSSSGGGSSTQTASLIDSPITGLDYNTSTQSRITDENGKFTYDISNELITFSIGNLKLADFNLSKIQPDRKVLIGELFNLDRNNTTDLKLIKMLRLLQSLDSDNNPSNGITIDDNTKNALELAIDNNISYRSNLLDNNITTLQFLVNSIGKRFILERTARDYYKQTLYSLGIKPQKMPFITVWEATSNDKTITIPINLAYADDYNYTVDWGDGVVENYIDTNATHTYNSEGNYTVKISGNFPAIYYYDKNRCYEDGDDIYCDYKENKLIKIIKWGDIKWKSMKYAFTGVINMTLEATDTPDLSDVTNMNCMFALDKEFNSNINDWNVSNITSMVGVFEGTSFNQPLDKWDVSNVTNMSQLFIDTPYNQNISNWNVSNVTNMDWMFSFDKKFNSNINDWNVSNVKSMYGMFCNAVKFNQPLNNWNVSNVTSTGTMFYKASSFNQPLNNWNVSNVTDMRYMFYKASSFNQPLNNWNVSNVTNMYRMFCGASSFDQNINMWDVSQVQYYYEFAIGSPIDGTDKMPNFY